MVNIGDKFKEYLPSWIKGNKKRTKFFDYIYEVIGFETEPYGEFAKCICIYNDGKTENLSISLELLTEEFFYKKI